MIMKLREKMANLNEPLKRGMLFALNTNCLRVNKVFILTTCKCHYETNELS